VPKLSLKTPLNAIGLPTRVSSMFYIRTPLRTVGDLIAKTERELIDDKHNGIGPLSIVRIKEVLAKHGLKLRVEKGVVLGLEHLPGCSPVHPCASCRVIDIIRRRFERKKKIPGLGFSEFLKKLEEHAGRTASRPEAVDVDLILTGPLAGAIKEVVGLYINESKLLEGKLVE